MMQPRRVASVLVAVSLVVSACSSTNPSELLGSLSIQGPASLRTAESAQFRAMRLRKDGSQEEVLAKWSVTPEYMTTDSVSGVSTGRSPGIAELRAFVDGVSAVAAVRVVPDMRGTWTGTAVFSCAADNVTRVVGGGPTPFCKVPSFSSQTILGGPDQVGDHVVGVFSISGSNPGPFMGRVDIDGSWEWPDFITTGVSEPGLPPHEYVFKGWRMTPPASGQVSGSGSIDQKFANAWGYQHYSFRNVTMTLRRQQ